MGSARCIGRIGALAVALGVGIAVTSTPAIGYAQPSSDSGSVSGNTSSSSTAGSSDGAASSGGSSDAESTASDPTSSQANDDEDTADSDAADEAGVADEADDPAAVDEADDPAAVDEVDDPAAVDEADDPAAVDEVDDVEVADDVADDVEVVAAEDGTAEQPASGESEGPAAPAVESSTAESARDGVSGEEPVGGSIESAVSESAAADDTDLGAAAAPEASSESGGQPEALGLAAVADEPAAPSVVTPARARTAAPDAAMSSSAPTLRDVVSEVIRETAQVVVDALDWVLAASGTSYDDSELPWGLALLAGVRREIDRIFLAPYRESLQADAALVLAQSPNLLVNPGAEAGDPSLSGNSAVSIPGWKTTGTPTAIEYGALRNSWPLGLPFALPNLPSFMGYPKAHNGPPDGGAQFFGGGNVADSTITQTVDLSDAAAEIDTGTVTYNLSGWLGGWLANLSSASVKVDFLDHNKTYLGTTSIGPVGVLERFFHTKLVERETSGSVPTGTRYAQVDVIFDQVNIFPLGINVNYNSGFADNIAFSISADLPAPPPPTPPVSTVGELDHVFMVYMENKGYTDIIGSPNAPFTNSLINAYGSANNFFGLTHPSLPNYYPVIGGTDYGLTYECEAVCIFDHGTILTDNIDDAGMTWRGYAQSQPPGQPLENSGDYSVAQLPFVAFEGIGNNEAYAVEHLFPLDQMAIDLSSPETAPDFAWFAANESFNGEGPIDSLGDILQFMISQFSPTHQYNVPALDQFLSETVPVIMDSVVWQDPARKSALIVTFDEDNDNLSLGFGDEGNRIVTVVIPSPGAVAGGMRDGHFTATEKYDHYSLMRMIEDSLGLPTLTNNDKFAAPMNEFWT